MVKYFDEKKLFVMIKALGDQTNEEENNFSFTYICSDMYLFPDTD